ncbi:MAG TPA: hypothetical protein VFG84_00030 [Gemmatimonadaceae bacterium]|nr:hypothetical protein [Gemmatimonadaceae bacterium]
MSTTLWRGNQLLGTLHLRASSGPQQLQAVLIPSSADVSLASFSQVGVPGPWSELTVELPVKPHSVEERGRTPIRSGYQSAPLIKAAIDDVNVPAYRRLHLRDEDGADLDIQSISLLEHRLHPEHQDPEVATLPAEAIASGSVWLVFAWPGEARATA